MADYSRPVKTLEALPASDPEPKQKRAVKSLEAWWFNRCRRRDKALGVASGRISKAHHQAAQAEWAALDHLDKAAYAAMADDERKGAYAVPVNDAVPVAPLPVHDAVPA